MKKNIIKFIAKDYINVVIFCALYFLFFWFIVSLNIGRIVNPGSIEANKYVPAVFLFVFIFRFFAFLGFSDSPNFDERYDKFKHSTKMRW